MTLRQFIHDHRQELDQVIAARLQREKNPTPTDRERELWVRNDEGLYTWARSEGVRL